MLGYFIILFGAMLRVIPHPANFAPIAALALFGGVYLNKKQALILPILAMVASDIFIGFDSLPSRLSVYGCFLLIGVIGLWVGRHKNMATVISGSLLGSILFYLITNFVFIYSTSLYPHTWQGLVASYINAIPFFRSTLLGDLFFTAVFFGAYELVQILVNRKKYATNHSR